MQVKDSVSRAITPTTPPITTLKYIPPTLNCNRLSATVDCWLLLLTVGIIDAVEYVSSVELEYSAVQ